MIAEVFWTKEKYPGQVALVSRPRGGEWLEDEIKSWARADLQFIVSLLEAEEIESFALESEAEICLANGIEFVSFPIRDRSVPKLNNEFLQLTKRLKNALLQGKNIGIHCRQSIGRAPLLAAVLMILFGTESNEAFRQLSIARGIEVPETTAQKEWAEKFAEELLPA